VRHGGDRPCAPCGWLLATPPVRGFLVVLATALVLRVAAVWLVGVHPPIGDEICYRYAIKWAWLGHTWPFCLACRPPGYGLFLHWLSLGGLDPFGLLVAQALISALTLVPLWVFGRRWLGERATVAACWLVALYPPFVAYAVLFMSETLYLAVFLAAIALLARPNASRGAHLAAGLALATATLVRSAGKVFLPIAVLWLLLVPWWPRRERAVRAGLLVLGLAVPFGLWTVRNAVVYGELIPADCQTMYNLWQGNPPPGMGFMDVARAYYAHSRSPSEREAYARERALEVIRPAPLRWLLRKVREQLPRLFGWRHDTYGYFLEQRFGPVPAWLPGTVRSVEGVMWVGIGVGGLLGLLLMRSDPRRTLVLLFGITAIAGHVVAFGVPRHRFPFVPFLALGVGSLLFRERGGARRPPPA
jgi:4-amino-4-deoxy-L-arabinose transferase-like glycosyltransferase